MSVIVRPLRRIEKPEPRASSVDAAPDDAVVHLGRTERWILDTVHRRGTVGFVVTLTMVAVIVSVGMTTLGMQFLVSDVERDVMIPAMTFSMVIPLVVAPPMLYASARLTGRLDRAGQSLRLAALTDPLTGVWNRRGFFEEVARRCEPGVRFEVSMIDVDNFKQLNDKYGHATGDLVLVRVTEWLVDVAAESGIVARMGGDEFSLVALTEGGLELPERQSLVMDGVGFSVTIGCASLEMSADIDDALARADAALYESKSRRN